MSLIEKTEETERVIIVKTWDDLRNVKTSNCPVEVHDANGRISRGIFTGGAGNRFKIVSCPSRSTKEIYAREYHLINGEIRLNGVGTIPMNRRREYLELINNLLNLRDTRGALVK